MQLAMYRGPAKGVMNKIAHWAVCVFTLSRYSHCELVIDGLCYSSSVRDGGVRGKAIDLASGHWSVYPLPDDPLRDARAVQWFQARAGKPYDWAGVARFLLPALPQARNQWFCSEACGAALGLPDPHELDPQDLLDHLVDLF